MAAMLPSAPSARTRLQYLLTNSEFHCVAAYRFGQLANDLRRRHSPLAVPALAVHRLVNRVITHIDHLEIAPGASIGPGLLLMHRHGVIIGPAVIGRHCVLHQNVTIGQRVAGGDQGVPRLGDDVWIGPGAVITGSVTVGDGVAISAGSVLSKDVPDRCLVAGNPARVIAKDYDNSRMIGLGGEPES
ncbi:serine O-acetyltransferase [Acidipropionibacterium jensenii]|nr:serine acetyltransferase [Acidipropionibacterium jensenii]MDN5976431.1 serine acetyltransferase [Acidipropionibacterium jensenii]MDN5995172.1 serine acetyltransferase [Acidipropionibacterium jensenii]MDN6512065.1 serine acetyltransferase [Acidipropionibacterium jensenii]MDN6591218.1 serine acetyltransferase [Acidipropionibacterium jensenii]MDN6658123.1 serine acetyltransferase [Acidipropionibacterium jensenii]